MLCVACVPLFLLFLLRLCVVVLVLLCVCLMLCSVRLMLCVVFVSVVVVCSDAAFFVFVARGCLLCLVLSLFACCSGVVCC